MSSLRSIPRLPNYGALDDFAAMAVLATLTMLYLLRGTIWDKPDPFLHKAFEKPQQQMQNSMSSQSTRDIGEKLQQANADIVIFWGSQSGTAEKLANRLCREIRQRFGKNTIAADMSDFEPSSLPHIPSTKLAFFIVSTYGEGEPSDNLSELWYWLEGVSKAPLSQLRYAALGLGNSNYKHYNAVVDCVTTRLDTLGAQAILPLGKADDAKGETEEHYLDWKNSVFNVFKTNLGYDEHEPVYEPSIEVSEDSSIPLEIHSGEPWAKPSSRIVARTMSPNHALPVKAAKELFTDASGRNCIHMEVDLNEQPGLRYKTGDHLGVLPSNPMEEVERLFNCLGPLQSRHTPLKISEIQPAGQLKVPTPTTLDALFGHYLEICAPVSRDTIASLIQFAPTAAARETLSKLNKDKTAYAELLDTTYINLGRLLQMVAPEDGAWSKLPLSFVIEALPAMRPRYYSISSSSVVQPRQVTITAVVADKTLSAPEQRVSGLCTNYLLALKSSREGVQHPLGYQYQAPGDLQASGRIFAHLRKSTFKLPALPSHPIIMVGAGTGVAPFRAFLQERARLARMGRPIGRTILIFGCRNEEQDMIYRDELLELQQQLGSACSLITAFSRPTNGSKMYVQDRITENSEDITDLLVNNDANFYICGSAAMARDVSNVLGTELGTRQQWGENQVQAFMDRQRKSKRWQQDVWG